MAVVSDDDIIRRKLLIEGDGGSDDKRITNLLKTFIKWSSSTNADSAEDRNITYQRILSQLAQSEIAMVKSAQVYKMNEQEQTHYNQLNTDIEAQIKDAITNIAECKNELSQAKRIRKNRQEYDALAKVIQEHPDRQDTLKQLEALDRELSSLKDAKESLHQKLELRKKQFHVLISAIHEMQKIVEEDENRQEGFMDTS